MQKLFCLEGKGKRWKIMVFIHTCFQTWKEEKKSLLVSSRYNQRKVRKEEKLKLKIRLNYREKHCLNPQLHESEWTVFSQHVLVFLLILVVVAGIDGLVEVGKDKQEKEKH